MKNYKTLFYLLPIMGTCAITGMEITTAVRQPRLVEFLHNNTVFIAGFNGFVLLNYLTEKPILEKIDEETPLIHDIAVNADKTQLAISSDGHVTVYNTQTGDLLWKKPTYPTFHVPIVFNSQNKDELIAHTYPKKMIFLHPTNVTKSYETSSFDTHSITPLSCYPWKTKLSYIAQEKDKCALHIFDTNPTYEHNTTDAIHEDYCLAKTIDEYICHAISPNNCYQALVNDKGDLIIRQTRMKKQRMNKYSFSRTHTTTITESFPADKSCPSSCVTFHPNGIILALLTSNYILQYWNYRAWKDSYSNTNNCSEALLEEISLSDCDEPTDVTRDVLNKRIAFSPNGEHILVALTNKCFVFPVKYRLP